MTASQTAGKHCSACQVRYQVWCFMATVFSFWAMAPVLWKHGGERWMAAGWRITFLWPVCLMCFSVPFLQVERHHKAIVSMAYVVTPCVWKDTFSSVIHKVVCWQKLRCAGGCEDGADPGRLTPLRLVLSGRQPVLWFDDSECDFRMEDWLYGSYKCSFTISSSREGGSAHSFDALKFVHLLMIFSWYSLLFSCTRTPTGTIMAHHLCFPGSACFCLCSVLPNRTALIWLQEGFQCCIRYSVNTWFYAINPSIVWKGDSGEFKNMTTSCGCVVLFWLSLQL